MVMTTSTTGVPLSLVSSCGVWCCSLFGHNSALPAFSRQFKTIIPLHLLITFYLHTLPCAHSPPVLGLAGFSAVQSGLTPGTRLEGASLLIRHIVNFKAKKEKKESLPQTTRWLLLRVVLLTCRHSIRFHLLGLLSLLLCLPLSLLLLRVVLLPSRHSQSLDTLGLLRFLSRTNLPRFRFDHTRLERPILELRLVGSRLLRC